MPNAPYKLYASSDDGADPVIAYPATIDEAKVLAQEYYKQTGHECFAIGKGIYLARMWVDHDGASIHTY